MLDTGSMLLMVCVVAVGGALGALLRYGLDSWAPAGIFMANTFASAMFGVTLGFASVFPVMDNDLVFGITLIGFLGALSTFSTVSLQAARLWLDGSRMRAVGLWLLHIGAGLAAVWLGASIIDMFVA